MAAAPCPAQLLIAPTPMRATGVLQNKSHSEPSRSVQVPTTLDYCTTYNQQKQSPDQWNASVPPPLTRSLPHKLFSQNNNGAHTGTEQTSIPPPPTYSGNLSQVRYFYASQWYALRDEPQRNRRSTTPRRTTRSTTPPRTTVARDQELVPTRQTTPPRPRPLDHDVPYPWLNTEGEQRENANRWGFRNRTPTPSPTINVPPPPPPQHFDVWGTYSQPSNPADNPTSFDPFAANRPLNFTPAPTTEDEDSDGLELPPAHLSMSRLPATPSATPEPPVQIYPQLQALANDRNYLPVAISGSDNSYWLAHVPAVHLRHMFPTSPGEVNLANSDETSWQLPSNILHRFSTPHHIRQQTQPNSP